MAKHGKREGVDFKVGKRDSEVSQMEKVALRKTIWIAFLLLQIYQVFLSLERCIFVESGTTSEVSIVGKNMFLYVFLLCPNGCRIIICCATFISAIATDILTFHFNKYSP